MPSPSQFSLLDHSNDVYTLWIRNCDVRDLRRWLKRCRLLYCDALLYGRCPPTFRRNVLPGGWLSSVRSGSDLLHSAYCVVRVISAKLYEPRQNSRRQKGDIQQVPCWEPTDINPPPGLVQSWCKRHMTKLQILWAEDDECNVCWDIGKRSLFVEVIARISTIRGNWEPWLKAVLSRYTPWRHWRSGYIAPFILNVGRWVVSLTPDRINPDETVPGTHWIGG
jgi:hypothetical protein